MKRTKAILALCSLCPTLFWPAGRLLAFRDLETGTFLTRDPAGMVDGPNLYSYVKQNPWTYYDPEGLERLPSPRRPGQDPFQPEKDLVEGAKVAAAAVGYVAATLADGVSNAVVAVAGGPGKDSYDPNPVRRSLGLPVFGQQVSPETYRQMQDGAENAFLSLGMPGVSHGVELEENETSPYSELTKEAKGTGYQAHHVSQGAAYDSVIPNGEGLAFPLKGNAFTQIGSPHYEAHAAMESFWSQYRKGGAMEGQVPTNSEYLQATQKALRAAGVPEPSAKRITEQAAAQQEYYGLQPNNPVPNVPAQMNQAKPKAQPNAGPVPVGKNQP